MGTDFRPGPGKDLRVRWALEEAGLVYQEKLLNVGEHNSPAHRALQPFGQVPVYEEDGLTLFETGAIVMHIGQRCPTLLPIDPAEARTRHHLDVRGDELRRAGGAEPDEHRPILCQ